MICKAEVQDCIFALLFSTCPSHFQLVFRLYDKLSFSYVVKIRLSPEEGGIVINIQQLRELRQVNIDTVDKDTLVDLRTIHVDAAAPLADRVEQYLTGLKNPYAYRVGEVAVKVEFSPDGKPLGDLIASYLLSLKEKT